MNTEKVIKRTYDDYLFYENAKWKIEFAWFPKRCAISKKLIWLEYGYNGVFIWSQLVELGMNKIMLSEARWLTKKEFIFGKIAGTI